MIEDLVSDQCRGPRSGPARRDYDHAMIVPPDRTEAAEFYFTYIDKVPPGDVRRELGGLATNRHPFKRPLMQHVEQVGETYYVI